MTLEKLRTETINPFYGESNICMNISILFNCFIKRPRKLFYGKHLKKDEDILTRKYSTLQGPFATCY